MAKDFSRNQLRQLAKQLSSDSVGIDDLEAFFSQYSSLKPEEKLSLAWKKFGLFNQGIEKNVVTFFTTKGGVLKTTLAYNFARLAALSGVRTLVIGLDMQCDITNCMSSVVDDMDQSLSSALEKVSRRNGLTQFFNRQCGLSDIVQKTDLKLLDYVPESPDLTLLNDSISLINRREFWLKEKVINPLLELYDLVILDCSPNWNRLTTNALCASNLLISPVECKINNFKNIEVYQELINQLQEDMSLDLKTCYVPTRFCSNKKLSREILDWYQNNLDGCLQGSVRESIESEEAVALQKSVIEYRPSSKVAADMMEIIKQISHLMRRTEDELFRPSVKLNQYFGNEYGIIP